METYEEYEKSRNELEGLKPDKDVIAHLSKLFGKMSNTKEELYSYLSDGHRILGGNGGTNPPTEQWNGKNVNKNEE